MEAATSWVGAHGFGNRSQGSRRSALAPLGCMTEARWASIIAWTSDNPCTIRHAPKNVRSPNVAPPTSARGTSLPLDSAALREAFWTAEQRPEGAAAPLSPEPRTIACRTLRYHTRFSSSLPLHMLRERWSKSTFTSPPSACPASLPHTPGLRSSHPPYAKTPPREEQRHTLLRPDNRGHQEKAEQRADKSKHEPQCIPAAA